MILTTIKDMGIALYDWKYKKIIKQIDCLKKEEYILK